MHASPIQHEAALGYESALPPILTGSTIPEVREELRSAVIAGLKGLRNSVPCVTAGIESKHPIAAVVIDTLDGAVVLSALIAGLRHSTCPYFANLRTHIALAHASEHGAELARVRGG